MSTLSLFQLKLPQRVCRQRADVYSCFTALYGFKSSVKSFGISPYQARVASRCSCQAVCRSEASDTGIHRLVPHARFAPRRNPRLSHTASAEKERHPTTGTAAYMLLPTLLGPAPLPTCWKESSLHLQGRCEHIISPRSFWNPQSHSTLKTRPIKPQASAAPVDKLERIPGC